MKLFIIRHAESANNRLASQDGFDAYITTRVQDPPITELGERQAQKLAEHVAADAHPESRQEQNPTQPYSGYGFTHLYCSAMLRAMQTALPVSQALDLTPEVWPELHEHGGIFLGNPRTGEGVRTFPGMTSSQIAEQFPGYLIPEEITEEGWFFNTTYEDMPSCFARATRVARKLRRRAKEGYESENEEAIAIIAHGTFIDSLLKAFFNLIPDPKMFFQHYNTAITRIDFMEDETLLLRYTNRTMHLPPEMFSV